MKLKTRKNNKINGGSKNIVNLFKSSLSSFVYSDAKHDFNNFYKKYKDTIKDSIPIAPYSEYTENSILNSIKITHINDRPNTLNFTIDDIINEHYKSVITVIDFLIGDKIKRRYDIKVIYYQNDNDMKTNPEHFIHYFEGLRTFIIDSFNLKFLDGFKNTNDNSYYNKNNTFYILYNREMQNDPGNKGHLEQSKGHFAKVGYRIQDVYDNDDRDIIYNKWNDSKLIYNNMFYSNYNLTLTNKFYKDNPNSYKNDVILKINDGILINNEYNNLKITNSIKSLIELSLKNIIPYSIAFTRKRCGDSLQVLSVFDNKRKLYSNETYDTSEKNHSNPKMIISLDRMLLYYSLLMGVDIGFTIKRGNIHTNNDYYLITFINRNEDYVFGKSLYNYSKNIIIGGKDKSINKHRTIKLKTKNYSKTLQINRKVSIKKNNMYNNNTELELYYKRNSKEIYNQILLPEIMLYIKKDNFKEGFIHYIINIAKYINTSSNNRNNIINYVLFKNNIEYSIEYISKIIYEEYIQIIQYRFEEYENYISKLKHIQSINTFYSYLNYDTITNKLEEYYNIHNNFIANNIHSLNCLIWIIKLYYELEDENTFNNCNKYKLKNIMTPKLQNIYDEQTSFHYNYSEGETENDKAGFIDMTIKEYIEMKRLEQLISIITDIAKDGDKSDSEVKEMIYIYEQICFTTNWDFVDLSRIISYIIKYDLNVYDTLIKLAGDYYHSMYISKPAKPGLQSTSISILNRYGYNFDSKCKRTSEIQLMIDEIYNIKCDGYIFEYKKALDDILKLFKRTFERYLIWGLEII